MKQTPSFPPDIDISARTDGYARFTFEGRCVVAREWAVPAIREALNNATLHEWAAGQNERDLMYGRGISYGVVLAAGTEMEPSTPVVVRRNRHGGLLRFLTGEYFLMPTRAPFELSASLRLAAAGVPTPELVAYAIYPALGVFARSDVMTRRLPSGADFPAAWSKASKTDRELMLAAVAGLLKSLAGAGAWHADLNLKNIYIAGKDSALTPYLLDVDRVTFSGSNDEAARNFNRLARSVRKWREQRGLDFGEEALARLKSLALENV